MQSTPKRVLFLCMFAVRESRTLNTQIISFATQSLSSRQGVFCHVLYDVKRTRSTFRDADSLLSCKDNLWSYVDNGSWVIVLFDYAIISSSPVS